MVEFNIFNVVYAKKLSINHFNVMDVANFIAVHATRQKNKKENLFVLMNVLQIKLFPSLAKPY